LASDSRIVMNVSNGTLFHSGTITSSAPVPAIDMSVSATVNAATIIIESLSGSLTLDGNGSGTIVTTGTGTINRPGSGGNIGPGILISALGANAVNMNANYTFNAGPTGFSTIGMRDASTGLTDTNLLGSVNVGAGVTLTATGVGPNIPPRNQFYGTINLV